MKVGGTPIIRSTNIGDKAAAATMAALSSTSKKIHPLNNDDLPTALEFTMAAPILTDETTVVSSQPSALTAEADNIRRLQREVQILESTLHAMGKKNRCSKEWITLNSKLDAAKEELDAVLEDQQLWSISSDGSIFDGHLKASSVDKPDAPSTLILSHDLQKLEDKLKQTPKWSLPWFEIKAQIDAEKKRCGIRKQTKECDETIQNKSSETTAPLKQTCDEQQVDKSNIRTKPPLPKTEKGKEPPAVDNLQKESIFRRKTTDIVDSISQPLSNVKTSPTYDSSVFHTSMRPNHLDVTVTVISVDGLTARRYEPKPKLPTQRKNDDTSMGDTVTVVASFSQIFSGKKFHTHIPSEPIEVETSVIPNESLSQHLVAWPSSEEDMSSNDGSIGLSSYHYNREFQVENKRKGKPLSKRYIPQTCQINISLSRRGKMLPLGKASLVVTGEETGESSSVIPISMDCQISKVETMKKRLKGKKSALMVRFPGDQVQFGLKSNAMLRVLVNVTTKDIDSKMSKQPKSTRDNRMSESIKAHQERPSKNIKDDNVQLEQNIKRIKSRIKPATPSRTGKISDTINVSTTNQVPPTSPPPTNRFTPLTVHDPELTNTGASEDLQKDIKMNQDQLNEMLASMNGVHLSLDSAHESSMRRTDKSTKKHANKTSQGVDNLLFEICKSLNFDIAEMWLHEGDGYNLTKSYVRPSNLTASKCTELQEVYHGEGSSERVHRLSMSLCKWAKKTGNVLWITEDHTPHLAQALKYSISGVQSAVSVPIYHEGVHASIIFFCMADAPCFAPALKDYLIRSCEKLAQMSR